MMRSNDWIILFDAVGTLIRPQPNVVSVYLATARQFGSRLEADQIRDRFRLARESFFDSKVPVDQLEPGSLISSNAIEYEKWQQLVQYVLHDVEPIDAAFESLWDHFAAPNNWQVYPDVEPCWQQLTEMGMTIGIASNFDARLVSIANQLPPLQTCQHIFYSGEVGFLKPDPEFFRRIASHFTGRSGHRFAMVGDNRRHDYEAPKRLGWHAVWLNRNPESRSGTNERISGLAELPHFLVTA
jgi:putative hydrolase of the HAD superfamily